MRLTIVSLFALASMCASTTTSTPGDGESSGDESETVERRLPDLPRIADLAPGPYLFPRDALGAGESYFATAELVRVDSDAFIVSVNGGPHQRLSRREVWPMACLREPVELAEGALTIQLAAGAPVFVLASTREAARVSIGLESERSRVVPRDAIGLDGCTRDASMEADSHVGDAGDGNAACLFADQETLDESAGLPIPSGAPLHVVEEDGDWARVEVGARGGTLRGWMSTALVSSGASEATADWLAVAVGERICAFPGRVDPRESDDFREGGEDPVPSIPPAEIERVVRNGTSQIWACYEARLNDVPDLRVQLEVLMLVDGDGQVQRATVTRGASADEALSRCVIERVSRWRFPAPRIGGVQVRRTFDLHPPEQ